MRKCNDGKFARKSAEAWRAGCRKTCKFKVYVDLDLEGDLDGRSRGRCRSRGLDVKERRDYEGKSQLCQLIWFN